MFLFIFTIIIVFILYYLITNHVHVDLKSFFKKGFKKQDNFFGVYCYTGKQGTGKTYSAIKFIIDMKLKYGYKIITNVKSFNTFKDTKYMTNIIDIINFIESLPLEEQSNYLIFFDEIFTILERGTRMNARILPFLSQLRKRGIIFVTTAQEWRLINIEFRLYVRYQVSCNMYGLPFGHIAVLKNKVNDGTSIRWDDQEQDFVAQNVQTNFSKGNIEIINAYDTFETISTNK